MICVDGKSMTEEEYIKSQGNVPLKIILFVGLYAVYWGCTAAKVKNLLVQHVIEMNRSSVKQ